MIIIIFLLLDNTYIIWLNRYTPCGRRGPDLQELYCEVGGGLAAKMVDGRSTEVPSVNITLSVITVIIQTSKHNRNILSLYIYIYIYICI